MKIITLPNFITLLRFPLAFAFLQENIFYRTLALLLAMMSDGLDGYFARRYGQTSRVGAFLDPFTDKFFVVFALSILVSEDKLGIGQALTLISRDFAVLLFGCFLFFKGNLGKYQFRSIITGKITTALQFPVLLALILGVSLSPWVFYIFIFLGVLAFIELYLDRKKLLVED